MEIFTIRTTRVSNWDKFDDFLDVSVKTGDLVFAPSWSMVMEYKYGNIDERIYTILYTERTITSAKVHRKRWLEVIEQGSVTLGCYCKAGDFCHREILSEFLKIAAEKLGYEVIMEGEV
jgi:uncharacterized protein YeaO (DUF488 family)